jgi:hypothetical protein
MRSTGKPAFTTGVRHLTADALTGRGLNDTETETQYDYPSRFADGVRRAGR